MKVEVYNIDGQPTGKKVDLPDSIFAAPIHRHAVYLVVKAQLANRRQGTHATKNRAKVRGGGRKPWRQKGRGVARAGSIRSPLWVGGGRVFGPQPRDYSQKVNKKVKKLARRSLLTARLKENRLTVIEDFTIESGKTRDMAAILQNFEVNGEKVLFLLKDYDAMVLRAGRNIPNVDIMQAATVSAYDLIRCKRLFLQEGAIENLKEVLA